jgi:hypothetical protein
LQSEKIFSRMDYAQGTVSNIVHAVQRRYIGYISAAAGL